MILSHVIEHVAATNPARLVSLVQSLIILNPEAREFVRLSVEPLNPDDIWDDATLTAEEQARGYDLLTEYDGMDE